jgi:hypothetical protein
MDKSFKLGYEMDEDELKDYISKLITATSHFLLERLPSGNAKLSRHVIGRINIVTGSIVTCDPFGNLNDTPLQQRIPPGEYALEACIVDEPREGTVTAYVIMRILDTEAVRWKIATNQNALVNFFDSVHFNVVSGFACIMDETAKEILKGRFFDPLTGDFSRDQVISATFENMIDSGIYCLDYLVDESRSLNCLIFPTGYGNYPYCSYFGYDEDNNVVCLLMDFNIISF